MNWRRMSATFMGAREWPRGLTGRPRRKKARLSILNETGAPPNHRRASRPPAASVGIGAFAGRVVDAHAGGPDDLEREGDREAAGHQEAHLPGLLAFVARRLSEAPLPQRRGRGELVDARKRAQRGVGRGGRDAL